MAARPGTWRRAAGVLGELLLTAAVLLGGFVFYQTVWTNRAAAAAQERAADVLINTWETGGDSNPRTSGGAQSGPVAFARLWIPEFGRDFHYAVLDNVREVDLEAGPGHYPGTQGPGEPGNFALAGHRVGRGAPFNDLDLLHTCSALVIETADAWLEYRVLPGGGADGAGGGGTDGAGDGGADGAGDGDCFPGPVARRLATDYAAVPGQSIVAPSAVEVLDPIPGVATTAAPGQLPLLTLTTCNPQFSAAERLIIHAVLVMTTPKADGHLPAVLQER